MLLVKKKDPGWTPPYRHTFKVITRKKWNTLKFTWCPQDDAKPHCDNIADDPEYEPIRQIISTIVLTMMSLYTGVFSHNG